MCKFLRALMLLAVAVLPGAAQQQPTNYTSLQWDSGLDAGKPGFCRAPGAYYATDTSKLYSCDSTGHLTLVVSNGGGGGGGTLTNLATGCGLTGGPVTTTGTISESIVTAAHNGTYAVLTGDCGKVLTTNTAVAWTIAQAGTTGFEAGKFWRINNVGSGSLTLTATTSIFYGGYTANISTVVLTIPANTGVEIVSDGTNYQVINALGGGPLNAYTGCASGCTTTIGASPLTITAATHGKGTSPGINCFTGTSPYTAAACSYTQATNGDIVLTYGGTLGLFTIQASGVGPGSGPQGPTGATGPTGPAGSSDVVLISKVTLGSTAATVTFTSLSGYTNLYLKYDAVCTAAGTGGDLIIQFNSDTAANYTRLFVYSDAAGSGTPTAGHNIGAVDGQYISSIPCAGGTAGTSGTGTISIPNYLGTHFKLATGDATTFFSPGIPVRFWVSTEWLNTAAITRIDLSTDGTAFAANSVFTLYGEK